jgi:hypothetical protein
MINVLAGPGRHQFVSTGEWRMFVTYTDTFSHTGKLKNEKAAYRVWPYTLLGLLLSLGAACNASTCVYPELQIAFDPVD